MLRRPTARAESLPASSRSRSRFAALCDQAVVPLRGLVAKLNRLPLVGTTCQLPAAPLTWSYNGFNLGRTSTGGRAMRAKLILGFALFATAFSAWAAAGCPGCCCC